MQTRASLSVQPVCCLLVPGKHNGYFDSCHPCTVNQLSLLSVYNRLDHIPFSPVMLVSSISLHGVVIVWTLLLPFVGGLKGD